MNDSPCEAMVHDPQSIIRTDVRGAGRIVALDGLRGVAILMVLVYHLAPRSESTSISATLFTNLLDLGKYGVDLFFVLSGFLITGILLQTKTRPGYLTNFFGRRSLRIFPLYYALLFVLFIALPFVHVFEFETARADQKWFWLYIVNISAGIKRFPYGSLNHLWSLAVEEQFYLVWPFIVLCVSRRTLARICWISIALAFISRMALILWLHAPTLAYTLTPCRMDSLLAGSLIVLYSQRAGWTSRAARPANRALPVIGIVYLVICCAFASFQLWKTGISLIGPTVLAFAFGAAVICSIDGESRFAHRMRSPLLIAFGKYSYALYLFHPLLSHVGHGMVNHLARRSGFLRTLPQLSRDWMALPLTLSLSFGSAWVSWHLFEKRFLGLNRFFSFPQRAETETGTSIG